MYDSWKFLVFISERLEIDTLSIWKPIDSARKHWANNHTVNWTYRYTMRSVYLHYSLFFSDSDLVQLGYTSVFEHMLNILLIVRRPHSKTVWINDWLIDWCLSLEINCDKTDINVIVTYRVAQKTGPPYLIANILKIPWPNCVEIGERLRYYMLTQSLTFCLKISLRCGAT